MFFSEEKNQKTFIPWVPRLTRLAPRASVPKIQKSFASFLQKRRLFLTSAALLHYASPAMAQHAIGVGTALTPTDLASAYSVPPDGTGLPPGSGTPAQGAAVYAQACAACHGEALQGQKTIGAPALIGGRGTLARVPVLGAPPTNLPVKTVESYWPYATTLFDYIRRAMPMNAPGSLTDDQVYSVSAYILVRANIVKQDDVLDARTLPAVQMPNRNGFVPDYQPASARRR
jgi:S-disulfanyl-L-cysteine oxidoreductase SoxD